MCFFFFKSIHIHINTAQKNSETETFLHLYAAICWSPVHLFIQKDTLQLIARHYVLLVNKSQDVSFLNFDFSALHHSNPVKIITSLKLLFKMHEKYKARHNNHQSLVYMLWSLTNEDLHSCQWVVLPIRILHLVFLLDLLGIGANGIKLPPLLYELLSWVVWHLKSLPGEGPVQAIRAQDDCRAERILM